MVYTYYDYLEKYYESYFDYYYEYQYWPNYYGSNTTYNGTYPPSPYQYHAPYNMQYITPPLFSISILCALLSVIITALTIYKIYHWKRKNKVVIGLTLFCIVVHLIQNIVDPITFYAWYINYAPSSRIARYLFIAWDISWCVAKLSLYILFIYRYWLIFKACATNAMETYIVFGSFVTAMFVQCALYIVYLLYGYVVTNDSTKTQRTYLNVCWAFLAMDTLLICVLGYLLCRSVLKLVISIHRLDAMQKVPSLHMHLSLKNTVNVSNSKATVATHRSLPMEQTPPAIVTPSIGPKPRKMISNTISNTVGTASDHGIIHHMGSPTPGSDVGTIGTPSDYQAVAYESGYLDRNQIANHDSLRCLDAPHVAESQLNGFSDVPLSENMHIPTMDRKQTLSVRSASVTSQEDRVVADVKANEGKLPRRKSISRQERRLHDLLHTATRIAVTMMISMMSSFVYQGIWLVTMELEHDNVMWISYTWCLDGVINMLCVYLSMSFALHHYKCLCSDLCKFHQCILICIQKIIDAHSN